MALRLMQYNVDGRVGKNGPNEESDVLLVRFFLRRLSQTARFSGPYNDLPLVTKHDDQLTEAVRWFQTIVKKAGRPVAVDGLVHHAPFGDGDYTINYLHSNYYKFYPQYKGDIGLDPQCPPGLKALPVIVGYTARSGKVR